MMLAQVHISSSKSIDASVKVLQKKLALDRIPDSYMIKKRNMTKRMRRDKKRESKHSLRKILRYSASRPVVKQEVVSTRTTVVPTDLPIDVRDTDVIDEEIKSIE